MTGQAKTDYQREYMRRRRGLTPAPLDPPDVRPLVRPAVRPSVRPALLPAKLEGADLRAWMGLVSISEIEYAGYHVPNWRRVQA